MSAKANDLLKIQEMYDVATQTLFQLEELRISKEEFVHPASTQAQLVAEGLANRAFRVAEEGGRLSSVFERYGFELHAMSGLRNRLAHAYGSVDQAIIWEVLKNDFPVIVEACECYCAERDIALTKTWVEETTTPDEITGRASECSIDGGTL